MALDCCAYISQSEGQRAALVRSGGACTSASNFLYSSSLDDRYCSISFLASSRASLTRFVLYSRAVCR